MRRITVNVDDETEEWLQAEADRLDRSKAKTGGRCIELLRRTVEHIKPKHFEAEADITLMQGDSDRVDALEERLAEVEARLSELDAAEPRHADASDSADAPDDESPTAEQGSLSDASRRSQHTPDAGRSERVERGVVVKPDSVRAEAEEAVQQANVHASGKLARHRREALLWAWDYLRQHGKTQSSEIANATYGAFWDVDLDYDVQKRYPARGLWQGYLRDQLQVLPRVDDPPSRGRTWEFVEEG